MPATRLSLLKAMILIAGIVMFEKKGLVKNLHADVTEPNVVSMVLYTNETFVIVSATVAPEFKCKRPFFLNEFAGL